MGADEDAGCRRAAGEALTGLLKLVAGTGASRKLLQLAVGWCAAGGGGGGVGKGVYLFTPRVRALTRLFHL